MAECTCFDADCWQEFLCNCCCCPRPCDGEVCVTLGCQPCDISLAIKLTSTCCFECDSAGSGTKVTHVGIGNVTAEVKTCSGTGAFNCDFNCDFETTFDCSMDVTIKINGMEVDDTTFYSATEGEILTVTAEISTTPEGEATCVANGCSIPTMMGMYAYKRGKITLNFNAIHKKREILKRQAQRAIARRMQGLLAKRIIESKKRAV